MTDNQLTIVLAVLCVVSLAGGSGLQWRPCPELSTSLRFPCRCKVEPFGPKLQLGAVSMDCDNVVFQTESPILPTGAPIISFSQRYSGQQVLPTQVIYNQSIASLNKFFFYFVRIHSRKVRIVERQPSASAVDFYHKSFDSSNGIAINSYSRRLMSINWPLASACLHQSWNANEVKIKVCDGETTATTMKFIDEQWARTRMSFDQFWGEPSTSTIHIAIG